MRVLTASDRTRLAASRVRMCYLVELQFPTGDVLFTTSRYTVTHSGKEWLGVGRLLDIKLPDEDATLEAHACEISLDGLDPSVISLALNEILEGSRCTIFVALFDPDTNQPLGVAFQYFRGTISEVQILPPTESRQ